MGFGCDHSVNYLSLTAGSLPGVGITIGADGAGTAIGAVGAIAAGPPTVGYGFDGAWMTWEAGLKEQSHRPVVWFLQPRPARITPNKLLSNSARRIGTSIRGIEESEELKPPGPTIEPAPGWTAFDSIDGHGWGNVSDSPRPCGELPTPRQVARQLLPCVQLDTLLFVIPALPA